MMGKRLILALGVIFLVGCKSQRVVVTKEKKEKPRVVVTTPKKEDSPVVMKKEPNPVPKSGDVVSHYIDTYKDIAMSEMEKFGIPASITLAQGILESGAGRGDLTQRANNHFGIKCHKGWKGERVYHDDDKRGECFRKYAHPEYSFRDHSLFLSERKRYMFLFRLEKDDYRGWAKGLRKAGYATDPKYPTKLISLIERYNLYDYDAIVLEKDPKDARKIVKRKDKYTVKKGDTLYSIARKNKITVDQLKALNSLDNNDIYIGQVLYVKPLEKDF